MRFWIPISFQNCSGIEKKNNFNNILENSTWALNQVEMEMQIHKH